MGNNVLYYTQEKEKEIFKMKYMVEITYTSKHYVPMETPWGAKLTARKYLTMDNVQHVDVVDMETGEVLDINEPEPGPVFENQP